MGFLDEAMGGYKPPTADDLDIVLPTRLEPREQVRDAEPVGEPRDAGQHGGAADGSPAATEAHNDAGSTGATAEPVPQRDDPDDGEHTDSTDEEVAARARAARPEPAEQPAEPEKGSEEAEVAPEPSEESVAAETPETKVEQPANLRQQLAGITASEPRAFQKTGFSAGGVETTVVKRFPVPLVDRLRLTLAPVVGGEFAEALSAPALITAFLVAKTGVELDVDPNTAVAVDIFRQVDPRLLAVEDKIDGMMDDVSRLADAMKLGLQRIGDTGNVVDALEFSTAYLIADRVAGLTTTDTNETNVDVTQKKALTARENIRKRAKAQRTIERQRDGRRMA